ncbi:hypothetical protein R3I94_022127 [Phoxinus phoxinus]
METQRILMRSLAVVFFASVIWTITVSADGENDEEDKYEKVGPCCTVVSRLTREQFTDPIIGVRLQKQSPPCVKAVVFETERGDFCLDPRLPWVKDEARLFLKLRV